MRYVVRMESLGWDFVRIYSVEGYHYGWVRRGNINLLERKVAGDEFLRVYNEVEEFLAYKNIISIVRIKSGWTIWRKNKAGKSVQP